ncbi:MAG: hypothetical protein JWP27_306 [Flaviaesturariibacter sp.]|nr:hypothetical protein [Flaviaesturariibacter sp.]
MNDQKQGERRDGEREDESSNRSHGEGTPVYLTGNSTLQSPEEHSHDQSVDPRQDSSLDVSADDLHEIKAGRLTGREDAPDDQNP